MNVVQFYASVGVALTAMGTRWKSVCPFHKEKDASFVVYPDGGFHCFGCQAHGTVEDIGEYFNVDYKPFPDSADVRNPLEATVRNLRKRAEADLALALVDVPQKSRGRAYDMFDALFMDVAALSNENDVGVCDLLAFLNAGLAKISTWSRSNSC